MSSLSPNEDARRTSPRKSAKQMPHYLARESDEQKRGKGGKKSGGGVKKQGKESNSLSGDDSDASVKPRKKSRGATGGRQSGEPSHSEFQGEDKSGESDKSDKAKIGGEREEDTGL